MKMVCYATCCFILFIVLFWSLTSWLYLNCVSLFGLVCSHSYNNNNYYIITIFHHLFPKELFFVETGKHSLYHPWGMPLFKKISADYLLLKGKRAVRSNALQWLSSLLVSLRIVGVSCLCLLDYFVNIIHSTIITHT